MVLFRVNQVPDRLYVQFLNLVGIEPFPPSVGPRRPHLLAVGRARAQPSSCPGGTEVATTAAAAERAPIVFTTAERPRHRAARADAAHDRRRRRRPRSTDVWDDLRYDRAGVALLRRRPTADAGRRASTSASRDAGRHRAAARRRRPAPRASASTRRARRWRGRCGPARPGSRARSTRTPPAASTAPATIVLLVPDRARAAHARQRSRLLAAGPAARAAARPADLPGVAADRDDQRGRASAAPSPPSTPSASPAEVLGRSDGSPGQAFASPTPPVLPRASSETVEVVDRRRRRGVDRGRRTSPRSGPQRPPLRLGRRDRRRPVRPAHPLPRRHRPPARRDPPRRRRDRGHRLPPRRRRRGNVGARTLTALRTTIPYIDGVVNLGPADRRRRRRDAWTRRRSAAR